MKKMTVPKNEEEIFRKLTTAFAKKLRETHFDNISFAFMKINQKILITAYLGEDNRNKEQQISRILTRTAKTTLKRHLKRTRAKTNFSIKFKNKKNIPSIILNKFAKNLYEMRNDNTDNATFKDWCKKQLPLDAEKKYQKLLRMFRHEIHTQEFIKFYPEVTRLSETELPARLFYIFKKLAFESNKKIYSEGIFEKSLNERNDILNEGVENKNIQKNNGNNIESLFENYSCLLNLIEKNEIALANFNKILNDIELFITKLNACVTICEKISKMCKGMTVEEQKEILCASYNDVFQITEPLTNIGIGIISQKNTINTAKEKITLDLSNTHNEFVQLKKLIKEKQKSLRLEQRTSASNSTVIQVENVSIIENRQYPSTFFSTGYTNPNNSNFNKETKEEAREKIEKKEKRKEIKQKRNPAKSSSQLNTTKNTNKPLNSDNAIIFLNYANHKNKTQTKKIKAIKFGDLGLLISTDIVTGVPIDYNSSELTTFLNTTNRLKILTKDSLGQNGIKMMGRLHGIFVKNKKFPDRHLWLIAHPIDDPRSTHVYIPHEIISHRKYENFIKNYQQLKNSADVVRKGISINTIKITKTEKVDSKLNTNPGPEADQVATKSRKM